MTSNTQDERRRSPFRKFISFILFRMIPIVLVAAIAWTGFRVIQAFVGNVQSSQTIQGQQANFEQTATAIADVDSANQASFVRIAQVFATNTPSGDSNQTGIVTSTPEPQSTAVPIEPVTEPTPFALPTFFAPGAPDVTELSGTAVPPQVATVPRNHNLVNILLLGGDDEVTDGDFIRTDSMIVVSINLDTNTMAMLSLPRDLFVYIPSGTMQRLNTAYSIGESIGWTGGGFGLIRQTIFYNLGINVHYYVRVNFSEFENIINTLGGVNIAVDCAYQDWYPKENIAELDPELPLEELYEMRTLPVGYYTMDGFDALWYARTRKLSDDFDRGRCQQQLLRAIMRTALDTGQLSRIPELWNEFSQTVETNLTLTDILGLVPIVANLDTSSLENFYLNKGYYTTPWQNLDGQFVQLPNPDAVQEMMINFYTPPTQNQIELAGPSVAVYNATVNEGWDIVAMERLRWEGLNGIAYGATEPGETTETILIDYTGLEKGGLRDEIAATLNIAPGNVFQQPNPERVSDYEVIVGEVFDACPYNVLPVETE